jgi:hypothetical protein
MGGNYKTYGFSQPYLHSVQHKLCVLTLCVLLQKVCMHLREIDEVFTQLNPPLFPWVILARVQATYQRVCAGHLQIMCYFSDDEHKTENTVLLLLATDTGQP